MFVPYIYTDYLSDKYNLSDIKFNSTGTFLLQHSFKRILYGLL